MNIQGTMGACEGNVKSATYGRGQYVEFVHDADELGFKIDKIQADYMCCRNASGLVTGEWTAKDGGMIAWLE